MEIRPISWSKIFVIFILLLGFISNQVIAQDLPPLGITRDERAATDRALFIWSSKVSYGQDTATLFSDGELYGLAQQAYQEMEADWAVRQTEDNFRPAMMGALAVGQDVYFASSIKGFGYIYKFFKEATEKPQVLLALERCQTALVSSKIHRTRGACAEVMCLHQFYSDPAVSATVKANKGPARVVAFGKPFKTAPAAVPVRPCGTDPNSWGCAQFMADDEVTTIPETVAVVTKNPPAVPDTTIHLPIC
ncbi:hypothetical protein B0O99DRAFT_691532 [Bisporella sp. PMI_857]|nr:hypothetical protein B0O99DRAFT_691532 [Bisporella sp. PMI_857]